VSNIETRSIQISAFDWQEMQRTLAMLQETLQRAESRIETLEHNHVKLDVEVSELEQIVKNRGNEELRGSVERWLSRRSDKL
jgi:septal ring factor EnvC (AmiA/AmiB activator)